MMLLLERESAEVGSQLVENGDPFGLALLELGLARLDRDRVDCYKRRLARRTTLRIFLSNFRGFGLFISLMLFTFCGSLAVAECLVLDTILTTSVWLMMGSGLLLAFCFWARYMSQGVKDTWVAVYWKLVSFNTFTGFVPEDVRNDARALQERCPEVESLVDEFVIDPFWVVRYKGKEYYLRRWDYPGHVQDLPF